MAAVRKLGGQPGRVPSVSCSGSLDDADTRSARSVFERALDVEPANIRIWLSYTEMELKARNIQHARNLFDRAVTLLPRLNQIWYKYVYLEELLGKGDRDDLREDAASLLEDLDDWVDAGELDARRGDDARRILEPLTSS